MVDQTHSQIQGAFNVSSTPGVTSTKQLTLLGVPHGVVQTGEDRLVADTGIATGVNANAAVRMHVSPVFENFWAYCPKTKTRHFQHRKVANLS